jgi:hypothetical protein
MLDRAEEKAGTILSAFTSAYSCVGKGLDYLPLPAFGNLSELGNLILHRLPVRTDPDVQGCALHSVISPDMAMLHQPYPKSIIFGWAGRVSLPY